MQDWSNLTRLYSMQAAWRGFLLSPAWGIGWGQFAFHFPLLVDPMGLQSQFTWPVVNNLPLKVLCETGLLGFMMLVATVLYLTKSIWGAVVSNRIASDEKRMRVVVTAAAVFGIWTQLLTFSQYNLPHIALASGLLLAALRGVDQTKIVSSEPATV